MTDDSSSEETLYCLNRRRFLVASAVSTVAVAGVPTGSVASEHATEIADWFDLDAVREELNGDYELVTDLDETTAGYEEVVKEPENGFEPIGGFDLGSDDDLRFTGTLDGQGNEIRDLVIDRPEESNVGLFGWMSDNAEVEDIHLVNIDLTGGEIVGGLVGGNEGRIIDSSVNGEMSGEAGGTEPFAEVGGLVGINEGTGTITNSSVDGKVISSNKAGGLVAANRGEIIESFATGEVTNEPAPSSPFGKLGGLVGINVETIKDSSAESVVTGDRTAEQVGGLVGDNGGRILNSSAGGEVSSVNPSVGGLVGVNGGAISESYATGDVTGGEQVGGLVGLHRSYISKSYATGEVTGDQQVGGLVGDNQGRTIEQCYATGELTGETAVGGLIGDFTPQGDDIVFADSYWDEQTTGKTEAVGEIEGSDGTAENEGLETVQMQGTEAEQNMEAFDFAETWAVVTEPDDYPILAWQLEDDIDDTTDNADDDTADNNDQPGGGGTDDSTDDTDDDTDDDTHDDTADNDDGFGPGFGVGGAVAGFGGVAYLLKRRLGTTQSASQ